MARYTGPACKLCRRSGEKLFLKGVRCFTPKCAMDRRPRPPGQHGNARRQRISDRGIQLREKQKARHTYGTLERQFKRFFVLADKQAGITGDNLLVMLERRLDNIVYRLGFADSRAQARQIVCHGHIMLNGRKTDIPSCMTKEGDKISWRVSSAKSQYFKEVAAVMESKTIPGWLSVDRENLVGQILSLPTPEDADAKFDGKAIVEFYSR